MRVYHVTYWKTATEQATLEVLADVHHLHEEHGGFTLSLIIGTTVIAQFTRRGLVSWWCEDMLRRPVQPVVEAVPVEAAASDRVVV